MQVVEAVFQAHLQGELRIGRNEPGLSRVLQVEMLDDDARLRDRAVAVLQHRKLAARPKFLERRGVGRIHQVDDAPLERSVIFIKRDQRLVTERRQRMEVEGERHGITRSRMRRNGFGYASTIILKPPKIMRLASNGISFLPIILAMRGSFITFAM